jgi:hypothetical protein
MFGSDLSAVNCYLSGFTVTCIISGCTDGCRINRSSGYDLTAVDSDVSGISAAVASCRAAAADGGIYSRFRVYIVRVCNQFSAVFLL